MISPNTIQTSAINDLEQSTENHDRKCSIDDSVESFDLVRMSADDLRTNTAPVRNRSTNILPFLALVALGIVSLVSIIQLSNSNTILDGTATVSVSNQQFERRLSLQKKKSNDYDSGLTLNYYPASIVVVENPVPDAEELITDRPSIDEEEKGAVEETDEERTKLVDNKKAAAALAVAGVAVVVNNSDLDRIENELDVKNNRDRNKEDVEGGSLRKPNTSGTVGGPYPNDVDAILDAIVEPEEELEPKPTRNRSKGTIGASCVFNGACEEGLVCVSRTCEEVTQSTRRRDRSDAPSGSPSIADPTASPVTAPKRSHVMGYYTGTDIPATAETDDYDDDNTLYPTSTPTYGPTEEDVEERPLGSMFGSMIGRNDDEEEEQDDYAYSNNDNDDARLFPRGDDGSNNARPGRGDNNNGSSSKVRNKDKSDNNDLLDHKKGVVVVGAIVAGAVIVNNLDESKQDREKDNSYIDTVLNETDGTAFVANTTSASTELTGEVDTTDNTSSASTELTGEVDTTANTSSASTEPTGEVDTTANTSSASTELTEEVDTTASFPTVKPTGLMAGAYQEEVPVEERGKGSMGSFCIFDRGCEGDMICVERTCVVTTLNGTDDTAFVANTTSASTEPTEEVDATASPSVKPTEPMAGSDPEEVPVEEEARRSIGSSCLFDRGCEGDMICVERTCVVTKMVGGAGQDEPNEAASIAQGEVEESADGANTVAPEPTNESNR